MVPWLLLNKRFSAFVFIPLAASLFNTSVVHFEFEYITHIIWIWEEHDIYSTYTNDPSILHMIIHRLILCIYYIFTYYTHLSLSLHLTPFLDFCFPTGFYSNLDQGASVTSRSQVFAELAWIYVSRVWNSSDISLAWEIGVNKYIYIYIYSNIILYTYTRILLMIGITT